jgi:hypothetical protein
MGYKHFLGGFDAAADSGSCRVADAHSLAQNPVIRPRDRQFASFLIAACTRGYWAIAIFDRNFEIAALAFLPVAGWLAA